jgi:hypothetical protein
MKPLLIITTKEIGMKPDFSKSGMRARMTSFLAQARQNLIEYYHLTPCIFLMKDVDGVLLVDAHLLNHAGDLEKKVSTAEMKVRMAMDKTDAYILITDAWMACVDKGETNIELPVRDRADKQEGINVDAGTARLSLSLTQIYHRAENGNGPKFEFEEEVFCETTHSVFRPEHWKYQN